MPVTSRTQLAWYLRQAFEQYLDEPITLGPWDDLVDQLAAAIDGGTLSLAAAARLDRTLAETLGHTASRCDVCDCPCPGVAHAH